MLNNMNKTVTAKNYADGRISRTRVERFFNWHSTFNAGYLIPFFCDEVYPNQNKKIELGELIRSITPLGPTMDSAFLDLFFFFVPNRLLWSHWEEFIAGYNKEAWAQDVEYTVPKIKFKKINKTDTPAEDLDLNQYLHSFMDYLPRGCDVCRLVEWQNLVADYSEDDMNQVFAISALYPRAYCKIYNDWFRSESVQDELEFSTGDADEYADEFLGFNLLSPSALPKANKYHNRNTDILPSPVKGPDVLIPMNNLGVSLELPVNSGASGSTYIGALQNGTKSLDNFYIASTDGTQGSKLIANNVTNTIRMLRLATQTELLLSRDARGGTRYVESLLSHFGVHNGDARLQRSEYLGSRHIPLTTQQVVSTADTGSGALGNVGGVSMTKDNAVYFNKAFSEHGILFCVGCVRTNLSLSSGVKKMYQRFNRFDFIWPEFKHVGDVPYYCHELEQNVNLIKNPVVGEDKAPIIVMGYTPYGSELREGDNFNNGLFRDKASGSLSYLTYQENFDSDDAYPVLNEEYIAQSDNVVSNTLIDQNGPQFYALFRLVSTDVIPLDPTSDPGLMDHF